MNRKFHAWNEERYYNGDKGVQKPPIIMRSYIVHVENELQIMQDDMNTKAQSGYEIIGFSTVVMPNQLQAAYMHHVIYRLKGEN